MEGTQLGLALKERGQVQTEEHNRTWVDLMRARARDVCESVGHVSTDDLRDFCDKYGCHPKHPNAWGTVFRRGGWEVDGMVVSRRPEARGRMIRTWRLP